MKLGILQLEKCWLTWYTDCGVWGWMKLNLLSLSLNPTRWSPKNTSASHCVTPFPVPQGEHQWMVWLILAQSVTRWLLVPECLMVTPSSAVSCVILGKLMCLSFLIYKILVVPTTYSYHVTISKYSYQWGFPGRASGKEPSFQCRGLKRLRFNPWVRKIPWRRASNPLQYSCLKNSMDRGVWQAMVHTVTKSWTTEVT